MENLIFSLGIAMPIFLVMCIGYFLKRIGMLNDNFVKVSNKMIFNVALPIKLIDDMMNRSFNQYFDIKFILFTVLGTIVSMTLAWILGAVLLKEKGQVGAFVQGSFRGNFIYVGLTLIEYITGSIGLKTPLIIAFVLPLYNILAVIVFTVSNGGKMTKEKMKHTLLNIIKNPLIIGIVIGIILSEVGLTLPVFITRTMKDFGDIVAPLALLAIGATFSFSKLTNNILPSIYASLLKIVIVPLAAVYLAIRMGFDHQDVLVIYVLFGVPTAATSYIMAANLNGDSELASNIIMVTTLLSVFSMTLFVFAFKTLGLIH